MRLDNYHAQLRMGDTKRWMVDRKHLPKGANGDTRQTLIDRQEMDLDVCKLWDAS